MKLSVALLVISIPALLAVRNAQEERARLTHGPFLGHTTSELVNVWARASKEGDYTLELEIPGGRRRIIETASADGDLTLLWRIDGLKPERAYRYRIRRGSEPIVSGDEYRVVTLPRESKKAVLAFGSCANERRFPKQPVWDQMKAAGAVT